jgi:hypothetical protein
MRRRLRLRAADLAELSHPRELCLGPRLGPRGGEVTLMLTVHVYFLWAMDNHDGNIHGGRSYAASGEVIFMPPLHILYKEPRRKYTGRCSNVCTAHG